MAPILHSIDTIWSIHWNGCVNWVNPSNDGLESIGTTLNGSFNSNQLKLEAFWMRPDANQMTTAPKGKNARKWHENVLLTCQIEALKRVKRVSSLGPPLSCAIEYRKQWKSHPHASINHGRRLRFQYYSNNWELGLCQVSIGIVLLLCKSARVGCHMFPWIFCQLVDGWWRHFFFFSNHLHLWPRHVWNNRWLDRHFILFLF